jgi:Caspase domain
MKRLTQTLSVTSQGPRIRSAMACRALIIAIENYSFAQSGLVANQLPGTLDAGKKFKDWLTQKWKIEGHATTDTEIIVCSDPVVPGGRPANRAGILAALDELRKKPQNTTEELFFFFSGHGFSFDKALGERADIIIASDFADPASSGASCLNLDEIIRWLRWHLGPGRHYYFVDACRNPLDASQVAPGSLLPWNPQRNQEPTTYVLQSTAPGFVAAVGGPFPRTLIDGLQGKGRAKVWDPQYADRMFVNYDSLRRYVQSKVGAAQPITHRVEGVEGETDGVLSTITPVPTYKCTIKIEAASLKDHGDLHIQRGRSPAVETRSIKGTAADLSFEPDRYAITLKLKTGQVTPDNAVPVDLYDDNTVVFTKIPPPKGPTRGAPPPPPSPITIVPEQVDIEVSLPHFTKLRLTELSTGETIETAAARPLRVRPGRYVASIRDNADRVLGRKDLKVALNQPVTVDLSQYWKGAAHSSIAGLVPVEKGAPDFSESLGGNVIEPDLNVWLALLGGGRIVRPIDYSKLAAFPLHDFEREVAGTAPIYILAGFDAPETKLAVGISTPQGIKWQHAITPPEMEGIQELYLQIETPGPQLISFRVDEGPPYTVASLTTVNRAMLITVTSTKDRPVNLSQYLLPIGGLIDEMALRIEQGVRGTELRDILFLARAAKAFRERKDVELQVKHSELEELLNQKWLDPIGCAMAAYEFIRRGKHDRLGLVVRNMKRYFPDVPDTQALAILSGQDKPAKPAGVPLFSDGLQAFPGYEDWLPLPANHLDFTSSWTAWRSAVSIETAEPELAGASA